MTKFPLEVQAYTVHRQCGSGMQAVQNAAQEIMCGYADFVLAGGIESMSNAQYYLREARRGYAVGNGICLILIQKVSRGHSLLTSMES